LLLANVPEMFIYLKSSRQTNIYLVKVALSVIIVKQDILIEPLCGENKEKLQRISRCKIDCFMPSAYLKTLKP
jgi:hypothetical protein